MGIYDRDYFRSSSGTSTFGAMRMWSVTTWLIVINVVVFVLQQLTNDAVMEWGAFSADAAIYRLQIWRFITFQFLHAGMSHIFFNMLALYFFGPIIEGYLGPRRYLAFYLLCGVAGAVTYLLLLVFGVLGGGAYTQLVGASAGIFGVLIAAAQVAPDETVMLIFPPIPIRLRVLAWILLGIAVWTVFAAGGRQGHGINAGGEAAHLGGAASGFLLIRQPQLLSVFDFRRARRGKRRFFMDDHR